MVGCLFWYLIVLVSGYYLLRLFVCDFWLLLFGVACLCLVLLVVSFLVFCLLLFLLVDLL